MFVIDIISFTISKYNDTFIKSMNEDDILFNIQYILESLATVDPGFTFNLAHDDDNNALVLFR